MLTTINDLDRNTCRLQVQVYLDKITSNSHPNLTISNDGKTRVFPWNQTLPRSLKPQFSISGCLWSSRMLLFGVSVSTAALRFRGAWRATHSYICSFACTTHSRAPVHSFICSLNHSRVGGKVIRCLKTMLSWTIVRLGKWITLNHLGPRSF